MALLKKIINSPLFPKCCPEVATAVLIHKVTLIIPISLSKRTQIFAWLLQETLSSKCLSKSPISSQCFQEPN